MHLGKIHLWCRFSNFFHDHWRKWTRFDTLFLVLLQRWCVWNAKSFLRASKLRIFIVKNSSSSTKTDNVRWFDFLVWIKVRCARWVLSSSLWISAAWLNKKGLLCANRVCGWCTYISARHKMKNWAYEIGGAASVIEFKILAIFRPHPMSQTLGTALIRSALGRTDPGASNGGSNFEMWTLGADLVSFEEANLPHNWKLGNEICYLIFWYPTRSVPNGRIKMFDPPFIAPGLGLSCALWISAVRHIWELVRYILCRPQD